jgi:hypothetical protein
MLHVDAECIVQCSPALHPDYHEPCMCLPAKIDGNKIPLGTTAPAGVLCWCCSPFPPHLGGGCQLPHAACRLPSRLSRALDSSSAASSSAQHCVCFQATCAVVTNWVGPTSQVTSHNHHHHHHQQNNLRGAHPHTATTHSWAHARCPIPGLAAHSSKLAMPHAVQARQLSRPARCNNEGVTFPLCLNSA